MPTEIERLYREHRAALLRLVERELHDHHDAEDVVQTAFLEAQRALDRGTIPRNPRAWLATIALNAGRRLRRRRLNAEPLEEYAVREVSGVPEIRAALANLPREQRAAVVYRDLLGLSYGETAEQMGRSVNAVTMLLHRGRRRLRETLGVAAGGIELSRWLKRAGMSQVAGLKGAATVVLATGLATTGIVTARLIAPIGSDMKPAALAARSGSWGKETRRTLGGVLALDSARRHFKSVGGSSVSSVSASTQGSDRNTTPASVRSSTAQVALSLVPSTLQVPTVSLPTLPGTATVTTPVAAASVTTPPDTTPTVTTPITTVTVPIP